MRPASVPARLAAGLVDVTIVTGVAYAASLWFVADVLADRLPVLSGLAATASYLAYLAYLALRDALPGGSLGKRLFGIRAVDADGRTPSPGRSVLRNVWLLLAGVLFPVVGYLAGALLVAVGLHDERTAAGTRVVRTDEGERADTRLAYGALAASLALVLVATLVAGQSIFRSGTELLSRGHTAQRGAVATMAVGPMKLPDSLPDAQRLVDRFYAAADKGDVEGVRAVLAPDVRETFTPDTLDSWPDGVPHQVTSVAQPAEDTADVKVREDGNGILGGKSGEVTFVLRRVDGSWYVAEW